MNSYETWLSKAENMCLNTQAFVDGKFLDAQSAATFDSVNPATEKLIASIASCDEFEVNLAVRAARQSFEEGQWSRLSAKQRKQVLLRLADLVEKNSEELALIDTLDMGKPIADSLGFDLPSSIDVLRWTAESIDKVYGEIAPTENNALALITREAIGVVAAIVPWNYPLMMAIWKIAPALAAGNSLVIKPSEKSSLSLLRFAELVAEAGIPEGVFNVVTGYGHTVGKALGLHADVDVITFTGSTGTGKQLFQYSGQSNMKKVWVETGGKSPVIVFADCSDLKVAAAGVAMGILDNQGETCIATSRLFVEESIKESFMEYLIQAISRYIPDDPLKPETNMGPLADKQHYELVRDYIASGISDGAQLVSDNNSSLPEQGYFVAPTVFNQTRTDMKIVKEEIFGPVLTVDSFSSWQEAVNKANATEFGLGAGIWTESLDKAHKVSREVKAGMVWVNNWAGSSAATPFGGVKQSGNGRDKSIYSLEKYTDLKTTWIALDREML